MEPNEIKEAWIRLQEGYGFTTSDIVRCLLDVNQRINKLTPSANDPVDSLTVGRELQEVSNLISMCEVAQARHKHWELVKSRLTAREAETELGKLVFSQIDSEVVAGRKIMAIKLYMKYSGLGLAESKRYIDNYGQIKFQIAK